MLAKGPLQLPTLVEDQDVALEAVAVAEVVIDLHYRVAELLVMLESTML